MLYSHEKLKIDIGLYDMETIIDLHGCYANPKETLQLLMGLSMN